MVVQLNFQPPHPTMEATMDPNQDFSTSCSPQEKRQELPKKLKLFTAAAIFYGNISFGCALNTYGPAITTLQNKYSTDDATISKAFSILTGCYMLGALGGGFLFNLLNRQLAAILILFTMSAMVFLTPLCPTLPLFFLSVAVVGLCSGSYDTCQFVWMMEMMQADCPPYVQCQHFFYAVGTNLVGFIMAPFLETEDRTTSKIEEFSNSASNLITPYFIVGILVSIAATCQLLLFIFLRYYPPPAELSPGKSPEMTSGQVDPGSWSFPKFRIILLSFCFFSGYTAMEMSTFQFFPKFGQNSALQLSESDSTYALTGMTSAFAIGRGLAIVAVFKISTQLILCGNIVLLGIANGLLYFWGQSSVNMLWVSGILFGLGFSSMYASFSAYMERYLNFTNLIGSFMLMGGSGTAAVYPLIVGSFIEENPIVLCYTAGVSIAVIVGAFGTLSYLTHKDKTRY